MQRDDMETKEFHRVVAAVISDDQGRILISQRKENAVLPLLWEFPGGKVEYGESNQEALVRELKEELGVTIEVKEAMGRKIYEYTELIVDFYLFKAKLIDGEPQCLGCRDFAWVKPADLTKYKFPPADEDAIKQLVGSAK